MGKKKEKPGILKKVLKWILVIFGLFILLGVITLIFAVMTPIDCDTMDCFVEKANKCINAKLELTDEIGTFEYRSKTGCEFTKTVKSLNEAEPEDMKALLEGKSLSCNYGGLYFDERWISSLTQGIENCDGELKEIIGQLVFLA